MIIRLVDDLEIMGLYKEDRHKEAEKQKIFFWPFKLNLNWKYRQKSGVWIGIVWTYKTVQNPARDDHLKDWSLLKWNWNTATLGPSYPRSYDSSSQMTCWGHTRHYFLPYPASRMTSPCNSFIATPILFNIKSSIRPVIRKVGYWLNIAELEVWTREPPTYYSHINIPSRSLLHIAKLSPSPNASFSWRLRWLYFQEIQPATHPPIQTSSFWP